TPLRRGDVAGFHAAIFAATASEPLRPQLKMRHSELDRLPPLAIPEGCACRTFERGDEEAWAGVLNACGQLGTWDRERVERALAGGIAPERVRFLSCEAEAVATACVRLHDRGDRLEAEIGWVAVVP